MEASHTSQSLDVTNIITLYKIDNQEWSRYIKGVLLTLYNKQCTEEILMWIAICIF